MKYIFKTEDQIEATRIIKSFDMALCLDTILNTIRIKHIKHNDTYTEEQQEVVQSILKDINGVIEEYNIILDELFE